MTLVKQGTRDESDEKGSNDAARTIESSKSINGPDLRTNVRMRKISSESNLKPNLGRVQSDVTLARSLTLTKREKESLLRTKKKKKHGILLNIADSPVLDTLASAHRRRRKATPDGGVTFGYVEIMEHAIIIGDNPGGFRGPPLSIEWVAQSKIKMTLAQYEDERPPRRSGAQMNIPSSCREDMLRHAGYSRGEIQEALRDVNIARRKRKRTIEAMQLTPVHEFSEWVVRSSLNLTFKRFQKRREREYIKEAWEVHCKMENLDIEEDSPVYGVGQDDDKTVSNKTVESPSEFHS